MQARAPYLEYRGITKRFPGVVALDDVSFAITQGSCHALIGENGAGKSTAGKILAGVYTPDAGSLVLEGREIHPSTPILARHYGISMVHQELAFCPNLTVAENLCLGNLPNRHGLLRRGAMRDEARRMLDEIEAKNIDVDRPISDLSTGQEQIVQIAGAIGVGSRIIVMDEPTSSLSAHESEHLFTLLAHLKERGITVIYVSHRMEEIFRLCDHITVLRDGKHVSTQPTSATTPEEIIHQMVGRELVSFHPQHIEKPLGAELLRVEDLRSPGKFEHVSFSLRAGEILGLAGLVGAGRSEVAQALFGLDPLASGQIWLHGQPLRMGSIDEALERRLGFLPEDRKRQGLVLSMNCRENASLAILDRLDRWGFVRRQEEQAIVEKFANRLRVKTPSLESLIAGLSGGNQQKLALAKWLARDCDVLIVDEPTRGVDVGAKAEIHHLLDELACQGMGILLISSELPEVMNLSRSILVLQEGKVTGKVERSQFSQAFLLKLMAA